MNDIIEGYIKWFYSCFDEGRVPNHELPELYAKADVFLFPSEADTFGMSVLEAQACGLPAVVSSVGGPREIIEDGVTGYVARAGDRAHWVARVMRIIDMKNADSEAFETMRKKSRERVLECFDSERVYDTLFRMSETETSCTSIPSTISVPVRPETPMEPVPWNGSHRPRRNRTDTFRPPNAADRS